MKYRKFAISLVIALGFIFMLKAGEPVVVTKIDSEKGYYLVCYDFGSDTGWQPLVGWVYKDKILLQSQITPLAP